MHSSVITGVRLLQLPVVVARPASKGPWYLVISCSQAGIAMSGTSTLSSGSRRSGNLRNARTQMHLAWQPAVVRMRLLRLQHRFKVLLKSACSPWLWSTGPWRMRRKMSFAAIRQPSLRTRWAGLPRQGLPSATRSVRTHVWWGGLTSAVRRRLRLRCWGAGMWRCAVSRG